RLPQTVQIALGRQVTPSHGRQLRHQGRGLLGPQGRIEALMETVTSFIANGHGGFPGLMWQGCGKRTSPASRSTTMPTRCNSAERPARARGCGGSGSVAGGGVDGPTLAVARLGLELDRPGIDVALHEELE